MSRRGISMNLLTQRRPDNIGWSDTCPFGGGGFHQGGRAWRFKIPQSSPLYGGDIVNNFLEFLGMAVNLHLMVLDAQEPHQCFLVLGDNTSGLGWIIRSGRLTPSSPYFQAVTFVARTIAKLLLETGHCLARQHIQGKLNTVPDLLSFVGDQRVVESKERHPLATENTTDAELTVAFHKFLPQLIPEDFEISPLPERVTCFIIQALQIADSKVEASFETRDRTWRRWKGFCDKIGLYHHSVVHSLSSPERELIIRGFLTAIRTAQWDRSGRIIGARKVPVAAATVKSAASHLASAFRSRFECSPLHSQGTNLLRPSIQDLLKAFDNVDPPPNRQKAITPRFLRALFLERTSSWITRHMVDLIIAAYFFACRSCEYVVTPTQGVTRRLKLRNITFRDADNNIVHHHDPKLRAKATFVTVCFENQKNRGKMDRRTHQKTNHAILCPVGRLVAVVLRILQTVRNAGPERDICTVVDERLQVRRVDQTFTLALLRSTCSRGGSDIFGFNPSEIGNRSIRSGAAMALFMTKTTPDRIMLLGRWKSLAFMTYIRPQVIEWSITSTSSMIKFDHFLDLTPTHLPSSATHFHHHHGRPIKIEKFNVNFDR